MTVQRAAIAGAGIAGLSTALALAAKGISVDLVEQAGALSEVGAGLQLSPNATRILSRLGVLPELEAGWIEPNDVRLVSGKTLRGIAAVPVGAFARDRWKAPYGVMGRAALQKVLLAAVERNPLCTLHLGQRLETSDTDALSVLTGSRPDLVVGADGVWSSLRSSVPGSAPARFTGYVAWRFLAHPQSAPSMLSQQDVVAFLGPRAHLVAYPIDRAGRFNIVAITQGEQLSKDWNVETRQPEREQLLARFSGWNNQLTGLIVAAARIDRFPLYEVPDGAWQDGRSTVLIGDAAHAMLPFAAQGAAMAIEDASALADAVSTLALREALASFEMKRRKRVIRVRSRGAFNRFAYHAQGPVRIARDLVLALRKPHSLAADFDWLYSYDHDA